MSSSIRVLTSVWQGHNVEEKYIYRKKITTNSNADLSVYLFWDYELNINKESNIYLFQVLRSLENLLHHEWTVSIPLSFSLPLPESFASFTTEGSWSFNIHTGFLKWLMLNPYHVFAISSGILFFPIDSFPFWEDQSTFLSG